MKFKKTYEKDAGRVVRWLATLILSLIHKIERPLYDYAELWEVSDFDNDEEDEVGDKEYHYDEYVDVDNPQWEPIHKVVYNREENGLVEEK